MAYGLKRSDLQGMADSKLADAVLLLQSGRASSAYYLAGYSMEFGLKACVARQMVKDTIPDKDFIKDVYQHNLVNLIKLAGLTMLLNEQIKAEPVFSANWGIVKDWSPESRYESKQMAEAQLLIGAISDNQHGALNWIKKHW